MMTATQIPTSLFECQEGLSALELDRRLLDLAHAHRRVEAALCFYLREMQDRGLHRELGFAHVTDYARERLGFDDRKSQSLVFMAYRLDALPLLKDAFSRGELPWTKVREAVKVATPETDARWVERCRKLSNRQLEKEVRQSLPEVRKKTLVFVLEGERVEVWEQACEALERLAGKNLTSLEVFDLMAAEVLCTYATTPALPGETDDAGGYARLVAERDGWICSRPGCSNRTALTGHHIVSRAKGGPDEPFNILLACAPCHEALTRGRLKVSGRAPDELLWEGVFGVIERPLPLDSVEARARSKSKRGEPGFAARETEPHYGLGHFDDHVIAASPLRGRPMDSLHGKDDFTISKNPRRLIRDARVGVQLQSTKSVTRCSELVPFPL